MQSGGRLSGYTDMSYPPNVAAWSKVRVFMLAVSPSAPLSCPLQLLAGVVCCTCAHATRVALLPATEIRGRSREVGALPRVLCVVWRPAGRRQRIVCGYTSIGAWHTRRPFRPP